MTILFNKLGSLGKACYNISIATELWYSTREDGERVTSWLFLGTVDRDDMRIYKMIVLGIVINFGVVRKK